MVTWMVASLIGLLGLGFTVSGATRSDAKTAEDTMPSPVPATLRAQRESAKGVGRRYAMWALLASFVTLASAIPVVVICRDVDRAMPVSLPRVSFVLVWVAWVVVASRLWWRSFVLTRASWLSP